MYIVYNHACVFIYVLSYMCTVMSICTHANGCVYIPMRVHVYSYKCCHSCAMCMVMSICTRLNGCVYISMRVHVYI